jgi:hypothetical protein
VWFVLWAEQKFLFVYFEESVQEHLRVRKAMQAYDDFLVRVQDIHRLSSLQGHLGWDQEVLMPP